MGRRRSRSGGRLSRRKLLLGAGAALTGVGLTPTAAFSQVQGDRTTSIDVATDGNALLGLYVYDSVEIGKTGPLVDVTNNSDTSLQVTVSLNTCTDGSLESPSGDTGCSAQATIAAGSTGTWQITTDNQLADGTTVGFDVTATSSSLDVTAPNRTTTAFKNTSSAVNIKRFQLENGNNPPAVDYTNDQFNVKDIRIQDNDGDADIVRRAFTVKDSSGNVVPLVDTASTDAPDATFPATADYTEGSITLQADETLSPSKTYTIKLTGYDAESPANKDSAERTP